jgi:hypothetical protein
VTTTMKTQGTTVSRWDAQRRRRGAGCLSDLTLDRLEAGELANPEAVSAAGHLSVCGACAEARASLAQARDQFLSQQNIPALAADLLARASQAGGLRGRPRWRALLAALGLCAGAAAALVLYRPAADRGDKGDDLYRTKGSLTLGVFVQHPEAGSEGKLHLGEPLHPGDRLRFKVSSDRAGHVAILGIDSSGTVSVYHPQPVGPGATTGTEAAGAAKAAPLAARSEAPLPTAIELDNTLGDEVVLAVRCADPLPVGDIVAAARKGPSADGTLALPCAQARYRITKVQLGQPTPQGSSRPAATP